MRVSPELQSSEPSPEPAVGPAVALTAAERRIAALNEHRPGLPAEFVGQRVVAPHRRIKAMVEVTYGQTAADAFDGLIRPSAKLDRFVVRRMLDALFPTARPIQLALPDATTPDTLDLSMSMIRAAWTSGQITPSEAEACQRLVRAQYRASISAKAGRFR